MRVWLLLLEEVDQAGGLLSIGLGLLFQHILSSQTSLYDARVTDHSKASSVSGPMWTYVRTCQPSALITKRRNLLCREIG